MGDPAIGWIAAIIIGGIAGWLAEQFMKSDIGLLMNIVLGIVGAAIASAIFSFFGIALGGWIGYLIDRHANLSPVGPSFSFRVHYRQRHRSTIFAASRRLFMASMNSARS
jgi:uncharacterized membrane protein YeaQ/YmgE (transglycosylase-associated protein family)